jgi:acetylornithine deacetylase
LTGRLPEAAEARELLSRLVAIDSVNPDLVPGGAGEAEIARFVAGWCEEAGLEVAVQEAAPGRPNVVAVARGTGGGRSLLLNGHLDTVGVAGMERPHQPVVEGSRLYGRGAYDMKGGVAAAMLATAAAGRLRLRGDVVLTAVADEENASLGTAAVTGRWAADAAVVTEPTELDVCVAHKGFVWLELETEGRAAHGSRPDLGVDAIAKMGRLLTGVEALDRRLRDGPRHPLLGTGSLHASLIGGGQERSSYPQRCLLEVERRTVPGETPAQVEDELRSVVAAARVEDPELRATVRSGLAREPLQTQETAEVVRLLAASVEGVTGRAPGRFGAPYWTDAALLAGAGVPAVLFGPGGAGAHEVVEWSDLDQVAAATEVLVRLARGLCA